MDSKKLFSKYIAKLRAEGVLQACLLSLATAFLLTFITVIVITLLTVYGEIWIPIIVGVCSFLILVPVFYFTLFKPTQKQVAKRLDQTGLEERIITMTELFNDQSYMAQIQRQDATEHLKKVDEKSLKIKISKKKIIIYSLSALICALSLTYYSLVSNGSIGGLIPSGFKSMVTVFYQIEGGGEVLEEPIQTIDKGSDTERVQAVPMEGWVFDRWSDGLTATYRRELNVLSDITITAYFIPVDDITMEGEQMGEHETGKQPPSSNQPQSESTPQEGSGKYDPSNQVINGQIYYADVFLQFYEMAMKQLAENTTMSDEMREIIKAYFDILYRENNTDNGDNNGEGSGEQPDNGEVAPPTIP